MSLVAVESTPRPTDTDQSADELGLEFVDDLDAIAGAEVMRGCGEDNPY
ncbi:hypothetical protein [Streptomyces tubercidicus]|nr:hypothetical protein OG690_15740 [Streptomyces tubercidicus]